MRNFHDALVVGFYLLGLLVPALAKDDPNYNLKQNFRPQNITGLGGIYAWVGSYYNATTQVDLIIERGFNGTVEPCAPLRNRTVTMQWDSILAILDRGAYNKGSNLVNMMLVLIPPNYNKSSFNLLTPDDYTQSLWWALQSSNPTWQSSENTTVEDYFNISITKSSNSFSLAGTLREKNYGLASLGFESIQMPTCNSSYYNGNYTLSVQQQPRDSWRSTIGWTDYKLPSINAMLDEKTANFTMEGKFEAQAHLRSNDTDYIGGDEVGLPLQGTIRFTFKGDLDSYHSDDLDMNTTMPTWLRTVGFGNNSMNVGYTSGGQGRPGTGTAFIVLLLAIFEAFM